MEFISAKILIFSLNAYPGLVVWTKKIMKQNDNLFLGLTVLLMPEDPQSKRNFSFLYVCKETNIKTSTLEIE